MLQVYRGACNDLYAGALGYGRLLAPAPQAGPVLMTDAAAALALSAPRLASAAAITRAGVTSEEHSKKERLIEEWTFWASDYPERLRPSLQWCTPDDVLAFMEAWRERHPGRLPAKTLRLTEGEAVPCTPSTLRGVKHRLSALCASLGRHGPWSNENAGGNPCHHAKIDKYLDGYERQMFEKHGYSPAGAVPMSLAKYWQLVEHLDSLLVGAEPYQRALILRDKVAFAYMWECGQRGKEAGRLLVTDFAYKCVDVTPAWDDLMKRSVRGDVALLVESSQGTKKRKCANPGVLYLEKELKADGAGLLVTTLPVYAQAMPEQTWKTPEAHVDVLRTTYYLCTSDYEPARRG